MGVSSLVDIHLFLEYTKVNVKSLLPFFDTLTRISYTFCLKGNERQKKVSTFF